jgi:D-lactate dehydrogenase
VPKWHNQMPKPAGLIPTVECSDSENTDTLKEVVYFPSCATRVLGAGPNAEDKRSVMAVMFSVLEKSGYNIIVPNNVDSQCCGMAFESKGQFEAANQKANDLNSLLLAASDNGRIPIVCDVSPCLLRMKESLDPRLELHEQVGFLSTHVMPNLTVKKKLGKIALHVTCSTTRMGLADSFVQLAHQLADEVVIPPDITCCGFAGDKGFSTPELNASALKTLAKAVEGCEVGYSNSRTCEIGLSEHSGIEYQSIVYLVDQLAH